MIDGEGDEEMPRRMASLTFVGVVEILGMVVLLVMVWGVIR